MILFLSAILLAWAPAPPPGDLRPFLPCTGPFPAVGAGRCRAGHGARSYHDRR